MFVTQILESQLKIKQVQVDELQAQTGLLKDIDPQKEEEIMQKKARVEERLVVTTFVVAEFLVLRFSTLVCTLGMCGNRILVRFRFLKTRTEAKRSNPKFRFPWLFSKPNLSHTNSEYLIHSHEALTFFTLRMQDSGMIGII